MTAPRATYRIQLHEGFTLAQVARIVPYLERLGVSHVYLSPITEATEGSEHGYDVTDPTRVAAALGGEPALDALARALHDRGMGILLDIVPNHMAASTENAWWADLLEQGAGSEHARTFDTPFLQRGAGKLRLPVLGATVEQVIARGELRVDERDGRPVLRYHDQWFPIPTFAAAAANQVGRSGAALTQLLGALPYELTHWRSVAEDVCYRRFFDITDLVGIRVEDPGVFARTHAGILAWLASGWIDGLRIDHIDGLRDPAGYLDQLARASARTSGDGRCYTVVEKILAPDENLRTDWQTDGATGYEFARVVSGFLVDPAGYARLVAHWRRQSGERRSFAEFVHERKRFALDSLFPAELEDVADRIAAIAGTPRRQTVAAVRELTASLDIYRTYINEDGVASEDRRRIARARDVAMIHLDADEREILDAVCQTLLLDRTHASEPERAHTIDAVARWQQLSGPVMAKGFEDSALYAWPPLLALNEVGGDPESALDADAVHAFLTERAQTTPGALNATSTHDTKRSEDVRARLLVLAEHPEAWAHAVEQWRPMLPGPGGMSIAPRDELVLLQTLVGAWPLDGRIDTAFVDRIARYMRKAAREAKEETSWLEPDEEYEENLQRVIEHVLQSPASATLRAGLQSFVDRVALHGASNALAQMVLKCAAPGVPDMYQGTESWRLDLVDPDNRRPVDFATLARTASELAGPVDQPADAPLRTLLHAWRDGRIKQFLLMAALACRARSPAFTGDYVPAQASGRRAAHVLAFQRRAGASRVLAIITRWPAHLADPAELPIGSVWQDTWIALEGDVSEWRCVLTGTRISTLDDRIHLADALVCLPVALLEPAR